MSLYSLRKSRPTAKRNDVSVDDFIDDALLYATGHYASRKANTGSDWHGEVELGELIPLFCPHDTDKPMRRATFTLTDACIDALSELAEQTGISRSRLIRIWADQQSKKPDHTNLLGSQVP